MTKKRQEAVQTERTLVEQTAIEQPKANVKYKDTIFRMLFSEPEHLLSLYNAVTGKDYRDPDALNVVTLENAVYMGMKNDLVFKRFRRRISWCFIMGQTGTFRIVQNCGCRMLLRIRCRIRRWN